MEQISLKKFRTEFQPAKLKAAEKLVVRECDETEPGRYVAYIDKGQNSYDVSITISKDTVVEHTCDCGNEKSFCEHRLALLMHIVNKNNTVKLKIVKTGKKTETEQLLDDISEGELKKWLSNLLLKNKDIAFSFINHFKTTKQNFNPEEAIALTTNVYKTVVGNKRNIDQTQIKKLIELWDEAHTNIVKQYLGNVADKEYFLCIHNIITTCINYNRSLGTNSVRIIRYVEKILQTALPVLAEIHNNEVWNKAVAYYHDKIPDGYNRVRLYYIEHLINLCAVISEERKSGLIAELVSQYSNINNENVFESRAYTQLIFDTVEKHGVFKKYNNVFKPVRFDIEYNCRLIISLIGIEDFDAAEEFCKQEIKNNVQDKYNINYWLLLQQVYKATKNNTKLLEITKYLLPYTYNFEDYQYVIETINDEEEKKKWRSKLLAKAINAYDSAPVARTFYIKVMYSEGNIKKMIEQVSDSYTPYQIILEHFEIMAITDRASLLAALIIKNTNYSFRLANGEEVSGNEFSKQVYPLLLKYFDENYLLAVVNKQEENRYYSRSELIDHIKTQLKKNNPQSKG